MSTFRIPDEPYEIPELAILLPPLIEHTKEEIDKMIYDAKVEYSKHVEKVIEEQKEYVDTMLAQVVEPFKPFAKAGACISSQKPYFYLDEEAYVFAAESGAVPTIPNKDDALAYLACRKVNVLKCCGYAHPCPPRLFG